MVGSLIGTILMICCFSFCEYAFIDILDSLIPYETSKLIKMKRFTRRSKYNKVYSNKIALSMFILQVFTFILCLFSIITAVLIALFLGDMPLIITAICLYAINTVYLISLRIAEVILTKRCEVCKTTEEQVKNILGFLCLKYKMNYSLGEYENYLGTNAVLLTYSYYNEFGCFTIAHVPVRGEVTYYRLDSIDQITDIILRHDLNLGVITPKNEKKFREHSQNILKHELSIFDFEPEIWAKHRKTGFLKIPFSWGTDKQILKALADVIKTQIEKYGSFFGIKVL